MPPAHGCYSCGRELHISDRDQIGLVFSSAFSCRQVSERVGLRVVVVVGYWRLPRRRGASFFGGMLLIGGWWGIVPLVVLIALPLDIASLRVAVYFLGVIDIVGETFWERFLIF